MQFCNLEIKIYQRKTNAWNLKKKQRWKLKGISKTISPSNKKPGFNPFEK